MPNNGFEFPEIQDIDDLSRQMEEAMQETQKAMDSLPDQMIELEDSLGSLSSLMNNLPDQMKELTNAMSSFDEQHQENLDLSAGEPDWALKADIYVGDIIHVLVNAAFNLDNIRQAWMSTQGEGFDSLVKGVIEGGNIELEEGDMGQILDQLQKGRSMAIIEEVDVLACNIAGAPSNAVKTLTLSPEANIPIMFNEYGIGFELAPFLTIRNQWENASIPSFTPMGADIVVPDEKFDGNEAFQITYKISGQEKPIQIVFHFQPY